MEPSELLERLVRALEELDHDYLDEWAERLDVADVWRAVLEKSGRSG